MSVVFCGEGQLLIDAISRLTSLGGRCDGVLSACPTVLAWARSSDMPVLAQRYDEDALSEGCDWLVSIGTPVVIAPTVLSRVRHMAINLHDGPLPGFAGLNAPSWALLKEAREYGVTWHQMTERVNAGPVVTARTVEILPDDTAFSLNLRCYEAALESFEQVARQIIAGRVETDVQDGIRIWHDRARRPANLGVVDPQARRDVALRTIRALDFGSARNPLGLAKLWTGERLLAIGGAEIASGTGPSGAVLAHGSDDLTVAFSDGALRLSGLRTLTGDAVRAEDLAALASRNLPGISEIEPAELLRIGAAERGYRMALGHEVSAVPPYPRLHSSEKGEIAAAIPNSLRDFPALVAAYAAWISGLTGAASSPALSLVQPDPHPALHHLRPLALPSARGLSVAQFAVEVEEQVLACTEAASMQADLPLRVGNSLALQVGLSTESDAALNGCAVLISPDRIRAASGLFSQEVLDQIAAEFGAFCAAWVASPDSQCADLPLTATPDLRHEGVDVPAITVQHALAAQAQKTPDKIAIEADGTTITYGQLDRRAEQLANALAERGAGQGSVVGLCVERSIDLVIAQFAILKTGAAYLPLDPGYPAERIHYMIEDSGAALLVATASAQTKLGLDPAQVIAPDSASETVFTDRATSADTACLIYTSGSTGKPKGVLVPHRTIVNFLTAMDEVVPWEDGAKLLAVTSVSFDISVLEIFWTLSRGLSIVLQTEGGEADLPGFSLFYFASEAAGSGHHAYRLLLEGAKFADENGFEAVWTPERHFHAFGGLYPNPAVTSAALAGITSNIHLRAGSFVAPLHHPVRGAEDWALVDNLSNGRVGIAFASGWQPNDFVIRPENFTDRKDVMMAQVEQMRAMWRGEPQTMPGHDGAPVEFTIHPKPVQEDIPLWLTVAGNPETFAAAGRLRCNVLTHLLGQSLEEVSEKLAAYRQAWREAGHPGMGRVTMMLHTFIADDEEFVRSSAREPMKQYLKSSVDLLKKASWSTPLIVERSQSKGMSPAEMFEQKDLTDDEMDALLDHAFERYYRSSGLFGTPETAKEMVRNLRAIGVDEIACLIDFGIDTDIVLAHLPQIKALMSALESEGGIGHKASLADMILDHGVTHFQCTPPMASFLAADAQGARALSQLDVMMVGGEAFPPDLAKSMRGAMTGTLLNMYGPTETTVWSSTFPITDGAAPIELGAPVANTTISIRSIEGRALPPMVEGELWIGGEGVTDGYFQRPDLTAERFVETPQGRFYRTGDLARRLAGGQLEFLGRLDNQVKIRGYRIELGEIEARLAEQSGIAQAVVKAVEFGPGDQRLVGYVTAAGPAPQEAALLSGLAQSLPEFMVPTQIVILDAMPLTPNGKIDRKALPHPRAQVNEAPVEQASNDLESTISDIWKDALGLETVSTTANFFDLGGHSLLTVQVQRRIAEALGRDVPITDVFRFTTIRSLAAHLAQSNGAAETGAPNAAAQRGAARAAARLARRQRG